MKKLVMILSLMLSSAMVFGQNSTLLSWTFDANTGSEVSATASVIDANISNISPSAVIVRGAGLTAANNAGRFNATFWTTTALLSDAITNNDYMEFTITPNSGFKMTLDSLYFNWEKSGSGPGSVTVRSSVDGYTADLFAVTGLANTANPQQKADLTGFDDLTTSVTFRFYGFGATGTAGSGGFESTGADLIVKGTSASTGSADPEPDNHVTGLSASATFHSISLFWTGSTGTNLPSGYLILGKTTEGSYASVVDGTPVANDNDFSDGNIAINVVHADGENSYTINGLYNEQNYTFDIIPYSNSSVIIDFKTDGSIPTVTQSTSSVELPFSENFDNGFGAWWRTYSVAGATDSWTAASGNLDANGFGDEDDEDWVFSAPINFDLYEGESLSFSTRERFTGDSLRVYFSADYVGYGDPTGATWNQLRIDIANTSTTASYSNWVKTSGVDLSGIAGTSVYLAFKYTGTAAASENWQIDSIVVDGTFTVPVELASFSASKVSNGVVLNWSTKTETNNSGFEIERSADKATWTKIGFVAGKGTTTESQSYSFSDKKVSGLAHYRLKQIDNNGSVHFSGVESVSVLADKFELIGNYPNPFNPTTTISFNLPVDSKVKVAVSNILGQELKVVANREFKAGKIEVPFNATNLATGMYFYTVTVNGKSFTKSMTLVK